jgi:hypothetical protein
MSEMQISRARIDPELHAQRTTERKFLFQLGLADYLSGTLFEGGESFSRLHEGNTATTAGAVLFVFVK